MRFLRSKEGFAGVFLVALLGSGLVIALLGIVVDGGTLFFDRRSHQVVADYSVEVLAKDCLVSYATSCASEPIAVNHLNQVKAAAASSAETTIIEACGPLINKAGGGQPCQALESKQLNCQPIPTTYQNSFVRVRTGKTNLTPGQTEPFKVLSWFGSLSGGYSVTGCAQAAIYGSVAANVPVALPLALPSCRTAAVGVPTVLVSITPSLEKGNSCTVDTINGPVTERSISGFTLVSLTGTDVTKYCLGSSTATLDVGVVVTRKPDEKTDLCGAAMVKTNLDRLLNKVIYLPTVSPPTDTGLGNYAFTVRAFTAFKLTGYKLKVGSSTSPTAGWWLANGCPSNQFCVTGTFEKSVSSISRPLTTNTQLTTPNLDLVSVLRLY